MKKSFIFLSTVCAINSFYPNAYADTAADSSADDNAAPAVTLENMSVTALRYHKKNIDIPADTETLTAQQLANTGANNLQEALKYTAGIVYLDYGPGGNSMGNMRSKILIRGSEALILVNGAPLNIRGSYNLSDIPLDDVDRVEIVRGGGSVLYGSDAVGGVINIITKKQRNNSVKTSWGNMGQQEHSINIQQDKLGIGYNYQKWGHINNIASNDKEFNGSEKNNMSLNYTIDDNWSLFYNHNNSRVGYFTPLVGKGTKNQTDNYDTTRDFFQINYKNNGLSGNFYYNGRRHNSKSFYNKSAKGIIGYEADDSKESNYNMGLDVNKKWQFINDNLLFGLSYQKEKYSKTEHDFFSVPGSSSLSQNYYNISRNNYSAYGQWEHKLSNSDTLLLSGRESWTAGGPDKQNFTNFSGQSQFIHKLNSNESIYISAGQSFKMPTLNQSGNTLAGTADLKPQKGLHYEIGWKKTQGIHNWQTVLFHQNIKDNITATIGTSKVTYSNEDARNTGIEITDIIKGNGGWNYNWGIVFSNPENNPKGTNAMGRALRGTWAREYGRWQLNGGTNYHKDKITAGINAVYLFERVNSPDNAYPTDCKPYLLTNFNFKYAFNSNQTATLTINNILGRDDIVTHSASTPYYSTPINFMIGYEMNF
ncbi:TonB-dependent receptor plug domain-containing protein [Pectinatus frisingensis]|uniref:TonB-dependent receptor plug domain-containing protein n=1 Tax=Pectinatus frisingensis TaxID=865 RepID=UPI0018C49854|nr:TonB-dependent receptor [Pectinatus frisingensis]